MESSSQWTCPEVAPGRVTERWQVYTFKITSRWSQSHFLSPGALSRVWCGHVRNAHGDNDVYVFSLNLSTMAASLWSAAASKGEERWVCYSLWQASSPSLSLSAKASSWSPSCEISFYSSPKMTPMPSALENIKEFKSSPFISTFPACLFLIYLKTLIEVLSYALGM